MWRQKLFVQNKLHWSIFHIFSKLCLDRNRQLQDSTCSTEEIIMWSSTRFVSPTATHVPGVAQLQIFDMRTHYVRGMATWWALFKGVLIQDIHAVVSWATPHSFVRFYRLDVLGPSLTQTMLQANMPGSVWYRKPAQHCLWLWETCATQIQSIYPILKHRIMFEKELWVTVLWYQSEGFHYNSHGHKAV